MRLWAEVEPFYNDAKSGAPKSAEARGTEAVLDALILVNYDARNGKFGNDTRLALDNMWALQLKTGEQAGAITWLNFHNEPWEADDSQYWGATLAAIAAGSVPKEYQSTPQVQESLELLRGYLARKLRGQSLLNRVGLLWASTKVPGLLKPEQRESIVQEIWAQQRDDGGWSASTLVPATWKRKDATPLGREERRVCHGPRVVRSSAVGRHPLTGADGEGPRVAAAQSGQGVGNVAGDFVE